MEGIQYILPVANLIQGRSAEYGHESEEKERDGIANGVDKDFDNLDSMRLDWSFVFFSL
jgi:hypothetical protein